VRIGQNPARSVKSVLQPANITIGVVNFIPYLSGFYEQSLDVLKACIQSIQENTQGSYDLMVFDNHSCKEVRDYLQCAYDQGFIHYLVLSNKNIGKIGAWNFMFGSAWGEYIVFADSDIYFRPGWLSASLDLFNVFPNVGMVTGRPLRAPMEFSTATLEWARLQGEGVFQEGQFLDWDTYWEHALSLGYSEERAKTEFLSGNEIVLSYGGLEAFVGAGHFQFMAKQEILKQIIPIASNQPMRGERALDIAINQKGYLRLGTRQAYVWHMGNRLPNLETKNRNVKVKTSLWRRFLWLPGIRHTLLWLHNRIFHLYFDNVE